MSNENAPQSPMQVALAAVAAMGETKFTPGPWFVQDNLDLNGNYWIGPQQFFSIAEVRNGADDEEYGGPEAKLANAHLIAASPDLYLSVKDLLGDRPDVQGGICRHCGRDYTRDIVNGDCPSDDCPGFMARAAIFKARGK